MLIAEWDHYTLIHRTQRATPAAANIQRRASHAFDGVAVASGMSR
jgi:hypothetical protein